MTVIMTTMIVAANRNILDVSSTAVTTMATVEEVITVKMMTGATGAMIMIVMTIEIDLMMVVIAAMVIAVACCVVNDQPVGNPKRKV
jgi:hypothetical protein